MKKIITMILTMALIGLLMSLVACGNDVELLELPVEATLERELTRGGYELVFEDEFEGNAIDRQHWSVGYGTPCRRGGYYADDAVFQDNGTLVIRTDYREDGVHGSGWYTGWVESASKGAGHVAKPDGYEGVSTKYGYYEVRCKAPASKGIWSAFWLMPDTAKGAKGMSADDVIGTGTDGVEIDIMESLHYMDKKFRHANQHVLHGDGYGENANTEASPLFNMVDMYGSFHTYGLMWTESEYIFYIDGRETWRTSHNVNGVVHGVSAVEEYMLLTVEIAGVTRDGEVYPGKDFDAEGNMVDHWAGDPNANRRDQHYDFIIDYVKVYQQR